MKTLVRPLANLCVSLVFVTVLVLATFIVGPNIESSIAPVVTNISVKRFEPVDGRLKIIIGAQKVRKFCTRLEVDFLVGDTNNRQPVVPRVVSRIPQELVGELSIVVYHSCHPFWITRTIILDHAPVNQLEEIQSIR